jgi:ElaB/YqjD/DUF883 family membrane-anchored ribosome-binding protein
MEDKRSFQQTMEEEINRLGRKIDQILTDAQTHARAEFERQRETLPPKLEKARRRLEELKQASGEAWLELKPGLQRSWEELRKSVDAAAAKFASRKDG